MGMDRAVMYLHRHKIILLPNRLLPASDQRPFKSHVNSRCPMMPTMCKIRQT
jgi:hypothetical protein